jgi:hypothetical protein
MIITANILFLFNRLLLYTFILYQIIFSSSCIVCSGPGSVTGIATGYGLNCPGIKSWWGRDFLHLSRPALGPTQPPVQWVPGLSWRYRLARAWRWPLTSFLCCGQESVELSLYSPNGPYGLYRASVLVQGCTLLYFTLCIICTYMCAYIYRLWWSRGSMLAFGT